MADLENKAKATRKNNGFLSGVFVLTLSAVIVKIIGLIYKIPMLRLLGSEGMGYFNSAYEIYALFCTVSTAGLPVAMSVLISSSRALGDGMTDKIFKVSLKLFLVLGIVGSAAMLIFAMPISEFLKSYKAVLCIVAISPTVLFICISSAYRGYFQGLEKMLPTAVSQVIEALGKLILGLIFAYIALESGFETQAIAAFAVLGLTVGTAISMLYLILAKSFAKDADKELVMSTGESKGILASLMRIAVPVTLSSATISITKLIDMTTILRRLQSIGFSSSEAFSLYGNYTTLGLPLFSLAPALISSVALPLVPSLSSAVTKGDEKEACSVVEKAVRLTAIISMPISLGLVFFPREILSLLFFGEGEAIAVSTPLLACLGLSVCLSSLITVGNAILQAYSRATIPIVSMGIGAAVKIVLAYFLIGIPQINIMGAPISTFFCDMVINAINFYYIGKESKNRISVVGRFAKTYISAFAAVGTAKLFFILLQEHVGERVLTLASIGLAALIYVAVSFLSGAIKKEDLNLAVK